MVAGCVSYRGYYSLSDAKRYAKKLKLQGYDVSIGGVDAYSTLGWFNDPLLNTMLKRDEEALAGALIHELSHQQVYVKGDTAFNESFATAVEEIGLKAWLLTSDRERAWLQIKEDRQSRQRVIDLILQYRESIGQSYKAATAQDELTKAKLKQRLFADLTAAYKQLRENNLTYDGFDNWFASPLNNASLVLFADYNRWVSAFRQLCKNTNTWQDFYQQVEQLARLKQLQRDQRLMVLDQQFNKEN